MKQLLLTAMFVLFTLLGFSQDYKLDELRTYYWNDAAANYEQDDTQLYSYANGGIKETTILGIDFSTSENYYQINKSYNANNDISLKVNQEWDLNLEDWSTFSEVIYDYDLSNKLISETTRLYNNTTMTYINESRLLYEYSDSFLIRRTIQEWDATNNDWINEDKDEMTYVNDLLDEQISSSWNSLNSEWILQYRDTLIYDTNNLLITRRYESYSTIDDEWELDGRDLVTYSGMLLTEILSQRWVNSDWRDQSKYTYSHDDNGNITTLYYEQRSSTTMELEPYYKEEMVYSLADPLSANEFVEGNFNVYPNPVRDVLNLDFDSSLPTNYEVQLFGMDGRLVKTEKLTIGIQKFQLHLADLQKGMYLLTFKGNQNLRYKILKE